MILRKLKLVNFKSYHGPNEIDLSVNVASNRNVVLLGGHNGAGKTSLLTALRLALYGKQAGLWGKDGSYQQFVEGCYNYRAKRIGSRTMQLTVEFETLTEVGDSSLVIVERKWFFDSSGVLAGDNFRLVEDGKERASFDTLEEDDWQDYISELIPQGVSRFFFFDGERIKEMATDEQNEKELVEAIRDILGINLYTQLVLDLETYERDLAQSKDRANQSDLTRTSSEIQAKTEAADTADEKIAILQDDNERLTVQIQELEAWIRRHGSGVVRNRLELQTETDRLKDHREQLQSRLMEVAGSSLPLILCAPLLRDLEQRLDLEDEFSKRETLNAEVRAKYDAFVNALFDEHVLDETLSLEQREAVRLSAKVAWERVFEIEQAVNVIFLHHDLSASDRLGIKQRISTLTSDVAATIEDLLRQLDAAERSLRKNQKELQAIPENPTYAEKEKQLRELIKKQGHNEDQISMLELEKVELANKRAALQRTFDQLVEEVAAADVSKRKMKYSRTLRSVLGDFSNELTRQKAHDVAFYLADTYQRLARKQGFIKDFEVNENTFEIALVTEDGSKIEKRVLSEGEKEIFAISMIWALSRASGKDLPMVIDTPLARLDSIHRDNIVENYLPNANRQVIVLSTDTEIDEKLYPKLEPYIAKEYRLIWDETTRATTITPGYFFAEVQ